MLLEVEQTLAQILHRNFEEARQAMGKCMSKMQIQDGDDIARLAKHGSKQSSVRGVWHATY